MTRDTELTNWNCERARSQNWVSCPIHCDNNRTLYGGPTTGYLFTGLRKCIAENNGVLTSSQRIPISHDIATGSGVTVTRPLSLSVLLCRTRSLPRDGWSRDAGGDSRHPGNFWLAVIEEGKILTFITLNSLFAWENLSAGWDLLWRLSIVRLKDSTELFGLVHLLFTSTSSD